MINDYKLNGANGNLYLYPDYLEIRREGILAKLSHIEGARGAVSIPYSSITTVVFRPGFLTVSGYFCFVTQTFPQKCNLIEAARADNCIVFRSTENQKARQIYKIIMKS